MLGILGVFISGILLGWLLRKRSGIVKLSSKLSAVAVGLLLFILGLGVGINDEIRQHLDSLGLTAFLLALFAIAGSLLTAKITWHLFFREK